MAGKNQRRLRAVEDRDSRPLIRTAPPPSPPATRYYSRLARRIARAGVLLRWHVSQRDGRGRTGNGRPSVIVDQSTPQRGSEGAQGALPAFLAKND